jgi:hypothetical protein
MMKFLPNGTSAKMTLGLKPSRVKTTRGRLGDGAKEHTFDIGFGELEAAWRDNRIEAAFKSGSDTFLKSITLILHFRSPQSANDAVVWTESYSDIFDLKNFNNAPGIFTRKSRRRGSWALWISEDSKSEGILFKQSPPAEYPVHFDCRPGKHRIDITWELNREVGEGERIALPNVGIARGGRKETISAWRREWFNVSSRTPPEDRRIGWLGGKETTSPRDLREILSAIRGQKIPLEWFALGPEYASATGDWLNPNEAFKDRMGSLSRTIGEQNLVPGLRFAPFLISRKSAFAEEKKDWLVKTSKGSPAVVKGYDRDKDQAVVLDVTNPDVEKYISRMFTVMRDQWGYRAYVLERMTDLAVPGFRHNSRVGPGTLMSAASALIRKVVGPKVLLVVENTPLLTGIGNWDARTAAPSISSFGRQREVLSAAAAQLHRASWNGRSWINTSGPLPWEFFGEDISDALKTATHAAALSCGMVTLCGDPRGLTDEKRDALIEFLSLFTECRKGRLTTGTETGGGKTTPLIVRNDRGWIALFNMSEKKKSIRLERDRLRTLLGVVAPLSAGDGAVFNSPEIHVSLPPRGHRLFKG